MPKAGDGKYTVIVCTYNRCRLLRRCLLSLGEQRFSRDRYDVLVVDNNSSDGTAELVREMSAEGRLSLRYLNEERQGLSYARNRGVEEATGEFVAFIDDDATAVPEWLAEFADTFRRYDPGVVGGRIEAVADGDFEFPGWFRSRYISGFFALDYRDLAAGKKVKEIKYPQYIGGGNACYRRALFSEQALGYDPQLGRSGKWQGQGEETLLHYHLERAGVKILFNNQAAIFHSIEKSRITKRNLRRLSLQGGVSDAYIHRRIYGRRYVLNRMLRGSFRVLGQYIRGSMNSGDGSAFENECRLRHASGYLFGGVKQLLRG